MARVIRTFIRAKQTGWPVTVGWAKVLPSFHTTRGHRVALSYRVRHRKTGALRVPMEASEEAQARRARRREWSEVQPDEFDKRHTRTAKFKFRKFNISMSNELFARMEAARSNLNYGNGMSRSEFIAFCVARYMHRKSQDWFEEKERGGT